MNEKKEEKTIQEIFQNLKKTYDKEDKLIEQELEEITKQVKAQSWKESKQILMIVIPILIIVYIFLNYKTEQHQKEKAEEALKIEQELKKN